MLESLRRLLSKGPKPVDMSALQSWAEGRGFRFKRVKDEDGGLVEPMQGAVPHWRIEWGDSHRSYIESRELRFSAEVGTPRELQLLVLNKVLMEQVERAVFEQYVEDVQTRIDTETPPEMRWLVMYPKLAPTEMGRLRDRYGAAASAKTWLQRWLVGPVEDALARAGAEVPEAVPIVVTITRGRLTLRVPLPEPEKADLDRWFAVFEVLAKQAHARSRDAVELGGGPSQLSGWPSSETPGRDE